MNQRARFFEELQRAIMRGFTLAAVSASLSCTKPPPAQSEAAIDSGSTADVLKALNSVHPQPHLREADGGLLTQLPLAAIRCEGRGNEPFYGPCCTRVHCYEPLGNACVAADEIKSESQRFMPRLPYGSGTCSCGETHGPFAQTDAGVTECCYLVGSMGCSGRPLREGEGAVVAAVVGRSDWA